MPCTPISLASIQPPTGGASHGLVPNLPSFTLPTIPLPMSDLGELFNRIVSVLPFGTILHPHLSFGPDRNVFDAVKDLLRFINIFLIPLKFIIPILQMILCIIEVLCSLLNPFKLARALRKLFRTCIPALLSLFPQAALILVIIALLLLILELIIYLIERIVSLIKQIIDNIGKLKTAIDRFNSDSVIAIVQKLGDFLCSLQNFFVVFGVIVLIVEVIQNLLSLFFKLPPCHKGDTDGCCDPTVCPSFIGDQKEFPSNNGTVLYFNRVAETNLNVFDKTLRASSIQLWDNSPPLALQFNNITHAFDLPTGVSKNFFPTGETYSATTDPGQAPYTVDIRFYYDPALYGRADVLGARYIRINDCIILQAPLDTVKTFDNGTTVPHTGTLLLAGGKAYEDDDVTIMKVSASDTTQGSLDTIIHFPDIVQAVPELQNTGFAVYNLSYVFKTNHDILIARNLISLGCHPDVAFDIGFINDGIVRISNSIAGSLGPGGGFSLPDIGATQDCIAQAIDKFRESVSIDSANQLQTDLITCLSDLSDKTKASLSQILNVGFDPYGSTFTVDPTIQFTTLPIIVSVSLNEGTGTSMTNNIPVDIGSDLAKKISGKVSFGHIGDFTYDGTSKFTAKITSEEAGNGTVSIAFDNQFISVIDNPANIDQTPSIDIKQLGYTFVQSQALTDGKVARDEGDVARE